MNNKSIIEETDDFIAYDTWYNYNFVTVIENKTNKNIVFCPYGLWKEFEVAANDRIWLTNSEEDKEKRLALLFGSYDYGLYDVV